MLYILLTGNILEEKGVLQDDGFVKIAPYKDDKFSKEEIRQGIEGKKFIRVIDLAKEELPSVQGLIKKHEENDTTDGNDLELVQNFVEMYEHLFETCSQNF